MGAGVGVGVARLSVAATMLRCSRWRSGKARACTLEVLLLVTAAPPIGTLYLLWRRSIRTGPNASLLNW